MTKIERIRKFYQDRPENSVLYPLYDSDWNVRGFAPKRSAERKFYNQLLGARNER